MTDGFVACCVIKRREDGLSGSVLFKGMNVIDICTKWFRNFHRFKLSRVNLSHGSQNWFKLSGVLRNRGWNYRAWVKQIQGKQGLVRDIGRFGKPRVQEIWIPLNIHIHTYKLNGTYKLFMCNDNIIIHFYVWYLSLMCKMQFRTK